MKLFALDDEVNALEARLPLLCDAERLEVLVTLAWHLRQRNTERALSLVDAARVLLMQVSPPEDEHQRIEARLLLICSEAHWLSHELDDAEAMANEALQLFTMLDDGIGSADAHWLLGFIVNDREDHSSSIAELAFSAKASSAVDGLRTNAAKVALARLTIFLDPAAAHVRWSRYIDALFPLAEPGLAALADDFRTTLAVESGEFRSAVVSGMRTYDSALQTGQIRRAITVSAHVGAALTTLGDLDAGLAWMQRGLALARTAGWPVCLGRCLVNTGYTHYLKGQAESARELLNGALNILKSFPGSDAYATTLLHLAKLGYQRNDLAPVSGSPDQAGRHSAAAFLL